MLEKQLSNIVLYHCVEGTQALYLFRTSEGGLQVKLLIASVIAKVHYEVLFVDKHNSEGKSL